MLGARTDACSGPTAAPSQLESSPQGQRASARLAPEFPPDRLTRSWSGRMPAGLGAAAGKDPRARETAGVAGWPGADGDRDSADGHRRGWEWHALSRGPGLLPGEAGQRAVTPGSTSEATGFHPSGLVPNSTQAARRPLWLLLPPSHSHRPVLESRRVAVAGDAHQQHGQQPQRRYAEAALRQEPYAELGAKGFT